MHSKFRLSLAKTTTYSIIIRRMAAYGIDITLLFGGILVEQFVLRAITGFPSNEQLHDGQKMEKWTISTIELPVWAYFVICEQSAWQATIGKWLLGLHMSDTSGKRIGFGQALLRTAVKMLPWELTHLSLLLPTPLWLEKKPEFRPGLLVANILIVVYIATMLFTPRKQSIHDLVAGTIVLRQGN